MLKCLSYCLGLTLSLLIFNTSAVGAEADSDAGDTEESGQPLWELGAGIAFAGYSDFRGSDQYNYVGAPIPIVVYRGDWLRVSKDEARARVFNSPRFEININGGGRLSADSDAANGRAGMPDLDPTFNVGPSFDWTLSDPDNDRSRLRFRLPVHAAFVASFSDFDTLGVIIQPQLVYDHSWQTNDKFWGFTLRAGPLWASSGYHDYYYGVKRKFATTERSAFKASSGYSGASAGIGALHRRGRLSLGSYVSLDYLKGATFENSPLVATRQSYLVGAFVAWRFWQSETRAARPKAGDGAYE